MRNKTGPSTVINSDIQKLLISTNHENIVFRIL
jgi:hypothetical protein